MLREQVNESGVLNLVRKFLNAEVMEQGIVKATKTGVPQGGFLSVVLSNVYLDKLDKELEQRNLHFVRYVNIRKQLIKSGYPPAQADTITREFMRYDS